jgi:hypothetical protein
MESFTIPPVYCPFPSAINSCAAEAQEALSRWAQRMGLVQGPKAVARFNASKFGYLTARAYPAIGRDELVLLSSWNTWLFCLDDQSDESGFGRDPVAMQAIFARFMALLHGQPALDASPLTRALVDLWARMSEGSNPAWRARFRYSVSAYFASQVWEATNRARRTIPGKDEYIRMRRITGALDTGIVLIDLAAHVMLPDAVRTSPLVTDLCDAANDVVCWTNDLVSLPKEMARGDVHNLVIVLRHQDGGSLQAAADAVALMIRERTLAYMNMERMALERLIPAYHAPIDAALTTYTGILRSWMRGNFDWGRDSGRYSLIEETTGPVSYIEPLLPTTSPAPVWVPVEDLTDTAV